MSTSIIKITNFKLLVILSFTILLQAQIGYAQCQVSKVYIYAVLANPIGSPSFDTDGNGAPDAQDDEFVQICNDSTGDVAVTGWTISDNVNVRYTFGTDTIRAGECITIINNYLGSMPMPSYFRNRGSGSSIWNNPSDDVILSNGTTTCTESYSGPSGGCVTLLAPLTNADDCTLTPASLSSSPIPIELINFAGKSSENSILINWSTASEINSSHFELYKSLDANIFKHLATVPGAGNSNRIIEYSYTDNDAKSTQYYQLKQIDYDGSFSYGDVILVKGGDEEIKIVKQTRDRFTIQPLTETRIVIQNETGQVVYDKLIGAELSLRKKDFAAGMYVLRAESTDGIQIVKWVNIP